MVWPVTSQTSHIPTNVWQVIASTTGSVSDELVHGPKLGGLWHFTSHLKATGMRKHELSSYSSSKKHALQCQPLKAQKHLAKINKYHAVSQKDGLHFSFTSKQKNLFQVTLDLCYPSCSSKWIRLVLASPYLGLIVPKSHWEKFIYRRKKKSEAAWSKGILTELFPLLSTALNCWPF